jgi:hypothetical protein
MVVGILGDALGSGVLYSCSVKCLRVLEFTCIVGNVRA